MSFIRIFLLFILLVTSACNPFYVTRAAYEELKILSKRQNISDVLREKRLPEKELTKLELLTEARNYSEEIGLKPKKTFTKIAEVPDEPLVWVTTASRPDSFSLYTWWFPIVGRVPYKGYFSKEDAIELAKDLKNEGYEVSVRGAATFSTLGWFNDPVFSSLLKKDDPQIVETVIHETVHTTIWFPNLVTINESMAHFIGLEESVNFYDLKIAQCKINSCAELESLKENRKRAQKKLAQELLIAEVIVDLYESLDELYRSSKSKEEKLSLRDDIFKEKIEPLREKIPSLKAFKKLNNAELIQYKIYATGLTDFKHLYKLSGEDIETFLTKVKAIVKQAEKEKSTNGSIEKTFFSLLRSTTLSEKKNFESNSDSNNQENNSGVNE